MAIAGPAIQASGAQGRAKVLFPPDPDRPGERRDGAGGGELDPRQRRQPDRRAGEQEMATAERQQRQDRKQEAEGGRVGVGEDEVELGAGVADRDQHRGR